MIFKVKMTTRYCILQRVFVAYRVVHHGYTCCVVLQSSELAEVSFSLNMDYSNKRTKFKIMSVQKDVSAQVHFIVLSLSSVLLFVARLSPSAVHLDNVACTSVDYILV